MSKIFLIIILIIVLVGTFLVYQLRDDGSVNSSVKNYVGNSAEECSRIQVMCIEGFQRFDDENGCGCEEI